MIVVVGLPGLLAHVTEIFPASAFHKVAAHRPLDSGPAGGTLFGVFRNPAGVSLLVDQLRQLQRFALLFALGRVVVVALAVKAEELAAAALDCVKGTSGFILEAVVAVYPRAELVIGVVRDE